MPRTRSGQPYVGGSETSYEAALRMKPFVSDQGVRVFRWLQDRGSFGGTMKEAEVDLQIGRPSLCARFKALEDAKSIGKREQPAGVKVKREGCQVYIVTGRPPVQLGLLGGGEVLS